MHFYYRLGIFLGITLSLCSGCYAKCLSYNQARAEFHGSHLYWHTEHHCWDTTPTRPRKHEDETPAMAMSKPVKQLENKITITAKYTYKAYKQSLFGKLFEEPRPDHSYEAWILRCSYELTLGFAGGVPYSVEIARKNNGVDNETKEANGNKYRIDASAIKTPDR